ncbi:acyltransferase 3 [Kribbella flavida DSM 17836]|uniref:Acyltransferase 3 n=1 Tax=Kribbella flavida (strain DSM 17836 / JCM 10339 / NBRC 14399) TaxID=479435 RepID=D2PUA8_KRIFD|nr:acyltransferase family protein [Kribbella flavida]ADB35159.1 acyltransferase 3 [Kribbella flavida DSM 17836]
MSGLTSVSEGAALSHPRPEVLALTGLRGLAGLAVVASSVGMWRGAPWYLNDLMDAVAVTLPFFFLLSGFVLAYNYPGLGFGSGRRVLGRYAMARIARIVPLFVVVGVAVLLLGELNGGDWVHDVYAEQTWFVGTLALCYLVYPLLARPIAASPAIAAGCALVIATILLGLHLSTETDFGRVPFSWLPVFVLGMALASRPPGLLTAAPTRWLTAPILVRLGVIGYPLYLLQALVVHGFGGVHAGTVSNALLALGWIGLTVLAADGAHRYVGVPARRAVLDLARRADRRTARR